MTDDGKIHKAIVELRLVIEAITRYVEQLNGVLEKFPLASPPVDSD